MSPKPGFYYYDSVRAFRVYVFIALFALGIYLSKVKLPSSEEVVELYVNYRVRALIIVLLFALLLFLFRRVTRRSRIRSYSPNAGISEPRAADYKIREEFLGALQEFGEYRGYKLGWVYYRGKELWPPE